MKLLRFYGAHCRVSNKELLNILGCNFSGQIKGYSRVFKNFGSKKQHKSSNGLNFFPLPIVEKTNANDFQKIISSFKNKYIKVLIVKKFNQEIESMLQQKGNSIFDFSLIIETKNINNGSSKIGGENLYHSVLDIIDNLSLCDAREIAIYHDFENEPILINRISRIELIKLTNNKKHPKTDERKKILAFVDTMPHLKKARQIEKNLSSMSFIYVTNDPEIYTNLNQAKDLCINSMSDIFFKIILKLGIDYFDSILVARVDSLRFQSIFSILKFKNLYTFDEGLFSIDPNSIYNSQLRVPRSMGGLHFLSSKIFNFPKGAAFFYKNTDQHFSWFKPSLFNNTRIDISKVFYLEEEKNTETIKKIFIGQPWQFMSMDKKSLIAITNFINQQKFDVYLIHPREDISIINSMLNEKISRVQVHTDGESFLVKMLNTSDSSVYTVASTIVTHLPASSSVKILTSDFYSPEVVHSQVNLIRALNASEADYVMIDISNKDFQDK